MRFSSFLLRTILLALFLFTDFLVKFTPAKHPILEFDFVPNQLNYICFGLFTFNLLGRVFFVYFIHATKWNQNTVGVPEVNTNILYAWVGEANGEVTFSFLLKQLCTFHIIPGFHHFLQSSITIHIQYIRV